MHLVEFHFYYFFLISLFYFVFVLFTSSNFFCNNTNDNNISILSYVQALYNNNNNKQYIFKLKKLNTSNELLLNKNRYKHFTSDSNHDFLSFFSYAYVSPSFWSLRNKNIAQKGIFSFSLLKCNLVQSNKKRNFLQMAAGKCDIKWDYRNQGIDWDLSKCLGKHTKRQSPIDINYFNLKNGKNLKKQEIFISYKKCIKSPLIIEWINHSIQVSCIDNIKNDSMGEIKMNGNTYRVIQFHLHSPSEHIFFNQRKPLELHIVHKNIENASDLLVTGFIFDTEIGNKKVVTNSFLNALLNLPHFPPPFPSTISSSQFSSSDKENSVTQEAHDNEENKKHRLVVSPADIPADLNLQNLIPVGSSQFYTYLGSLTTPPCTENVTWYILKEKLFASEDQLEKFRKFFAFFGTKGNYRIIQNHPTIEGNTQDVFVVQGTNK